jgi:DNA polymerase-3 subunit gamma/tau
MSYQVLARKWRPNCFAELVGQEHVVTAISNALDNNRLHHAYLFTGTRGVGKTTIARIFSKSLNCEQGLSATPCGQCSTCKEIEQGNFIDLLEIDAASRTKVEDTRELLDNVQYKPSRGRYKVYLIDEVHMLSKHSFNALLKTLEEPPPHVKFLLATTDPQKLPVTILSRCLQFNLKALSRAQISQQLDYVLGEENIESDKEALSQLARAAQGSMRDALSLTDQAIAQGNGVVGLTIVTDMLGLMDKNQVLKLVYALVQKDSASVMQQVEVMAQQAPDYALVLSEIMSLLHQVALTQFVPDACKLETISARAIFQLAKSTPAEQIQLLYQIALTGKKDLPHAADARTGLEMTLLRMLAFCPGNLVMDAEEIMEQTPQADVLTQPTQLPEVPSSAANALNSVVSEPSSELVSEPVSVHAPVVAETSEVSNIIHEPFESHNDLDNQQQNRQEEQSLFAQQQDIVAQAQDFGHQPVDYNEMQPVDLDDSHPESFNVEANLVESDNVVSELNTDSHDAASVNIENTLPPAPATTAELIALRNKLKQNQSEKEDNAQQVKKSESSPRQNQSFADLVATRTNNTQAEQVPSGAVKEDVKSKVIDESIPIPSETAPWATAPSDIDTSFKSTAIDSALQPTEVARNVEPSPPWQGDVNQQDKPVQSRFSAPKTLITTEPFDSTAHLDEENVEGVTLDIPAFLPDNQKVVSSPQVDDWSKMIEQMRLTALTKQLALHSAFSQQSDVVRLVLLDSKAHLNSDTAQQQLHQALCAGLNQNIQLEIVLGQPINTPYALQIKINQVRKEYAINVINTDEGIALLKQQFAANVMQDSIQAR